MLAKIDVPAEEVCVDASGGLSTLLENTLRRM